MWSGKCFRKKELQTLHCLCFTHSWSAKRKSFFDEFNDLYQFNENTRKKCRATHKSYLNWMNMYKVCLSSYRINFTMVCKKCVYALFLCLFHCFSFIVHVLVIVLPSGLKYKCLQKHFCYNNIIEHEFSEFNLNSVKSIKFAYFSVFLSSSFYSISGAMCT